MQYYCGAIMNSVVKGLKISMYIHIYFGLLFKALGVRCLLCVVYLRKLVHICNSFTFSDAKEVEAVQYEK